MSEQRSKGRAIAFRIGWTLLSLIPACTSHPASPSPARPSKTQDSVSRPSEPIGATTRPISAFRQPGAVGSLAISHDGKLIAVATSKKVNLYSLPSRKLVHEFSAGGYAVEKLQFSDDGGVLLAVSGSGLFNATSYISCWRTKDGKKLFHNRDEQWTGNLLFRSYDADLSPNGRLIALSYFPYLVNLETGKASELKTEPLMRAVILRFSADSSKVLFWREISGPPEPPLGCQVMDIATREITETYQSVGGDFSKAVDLRMNDSRVLSVKDNQNVGWLNMETGKWESILELDEGDEILRGGVAHDSRFVACADETQLKVYDTAAGKKVYSLRHEIEVDVVPIKTVPKAATWLGTTLIIGRSDGSLAAYRMVDQRRDQ